MKIVVMLVLLYLAIFLHELGHFAEARRLKLPVKRFSVGFAPFGLGWEFRLKRYPGMTCCLGLLPMGGYVLLASDEDEALPDEWARLSFKDTALFSGAGIWVNILSALVAAILMRRLLSPWDWNLVDTSLLILVAALYLGKSVFCRFLILPLGLLQMGLLVYSLLTHGVQESIGGPVTFMQDVTPQGLEFTEVFGKFIVASLALAFMNMMPITPLDGATLMDHVLRRWERLHDWYGRITAILALGLFGCAFYQDIKRLVLAIFR